MKKEVPLNRGKWIVEPGCVVLVTSGTMKRANVMTFSWQTPVNTANPCLVLLVMHHARYSYELVKENRELVINVPGEDLLDATHFVGTVTGRGIDKFAQAGLTKTAAKRVAPPLIEECAGHLECRVVQVFEMQTHDLLVCEVVRALAEEDFFEGRWIPERFHTLHYLCGNKYGVMTRQIEAEQAKSPGSGLGFASDPP